VRAAIDTLTTRDTDLLLSSLWPLVVDAVKVAAIKAVDDNVARCRRIGERGERGGRYRVPPRHRRRGEQRADDRDNHGARDEAITSLCLKRSADDGHVWQAALPKSPIPSPLCALM
jgi:hypothetical protein